MNASTLKLLLLAQMKMHGLSDEQIAPAHPGFWGCVLGVWARGDGLLARVRYNQERVGVVERGQDQSITMPRSVVIRGGTLNIMSRGGKQFRPRSDWWGRDG